MLQKLSYFNLILAVVYLLVYLKSGTFNSTAGIFVIIVFSWLCLRSYQLDNYIWKVWHYLTGAWGLYFIGTIIYGIFNIVGPAIEYNFMSNDTLTYLIIGVVFCVSVLTHIIIYFLKNYKELKG
ncbi:hypothetical protein EZ428_02075 [Pedobacter frigiditerrae]|uniref:Uncharacterized protein n=1 Tax=Pedobacter frigiditerrae TaxID=2530452 RepID=A0A4R0N1E5_9SPHI|nr:hypothetical protein [Pedobacter frigiditerrae]TCC93581.1 hypothetical protein EZ428_02075 [Pedobacter frigiditerrae]